MKCPKCSSEVQATSKFCPNCGAPTNPTPPQQEQPPQEKKSNLPKTVGKIIGGIVLVALIGSCMSDNKDNKNTAATTKAPAKIVAQLPADQVNFLKTVGITDPKVTEDNGNSKVFTSKGNSYKLYMNDQKGIKQVSKVIGAREWYVWTDDHGKWSVPDNDGKYIIVNIDEMNGFLKSNAARASKNYKGTYVKFTGRLRTIDSDGTYFTVEGNNRYAFMNSFRCKIRNKKLQEILINKNSGNTITVKGKITDVGEVLGYTIDTEELQ